MTVTVQSSSIEFWCVSMIQNLIRYMARSGMFVAVPGDSISPIREEAVIRRFNRRPRTSERREQTPESSISMPGIVCTYLGHRRPVNQGENTVDDGIVQILVQLVDSGEDSDSPNDATYLNWMSQIRRRLQEDQATNRSPLEDCPLQAGQVYLVHVSEIAPTDETDWAFQEHYRQALSIECFTRTTRGNYQ